MICPNMDSTHLTNFYRYELVNALLNLVHFDDVFQPRRLTSRILLQWNVTAEANAIK